MEIPRLHYDGSFVIKVLVMWSQMEVTTRFRVKWPPRCFDDSDVVHCFSDWGWTREFKEVFQHQNHTRGIKFTSVLLWQKSEMDLSWSVETKPNTNRVKQPFRDVSVDGSFLFLRTLHMKHMYDKMILTHRFTSTLIGSGDLYSSKNQCFRGKQIFSEMSHTKSYRWCCREADVLPASCCVVLLLFLRFVQARVPSVFF